jgi:hypothetical protein
MRTTNHDPQTTNCCAKQSQFPKSPKSTQAPFHKQLTKIFALSVAQKQTQNKPNFSPVSGPQSQNKPDFCTIGPVYCL